MQRPLALGEFLLGYPNEYGKYTDRPLIDLVTTGANLFQPLKTWPSALISAATAPIWSCAI